MPFTGGNEVTVNQFTSSIQSTSSTPSITDAIVDERPMQSIAVDPNGNIVVTWSSLGQEFPVDEPDFYGVYARRYDATTGQWSNEFQVNRDTTAAGDQRSGNQLASAVAMDDTGNFIITWSSDSFYQAEDRSSFGVFAQRYDSSGNAIGNPFVINTTTSSEQSDASVALDSDGDFVVSWTSRNQDSTGTRGIFVRRFNKDGSVLTAEIQANTYTTQDQIHSSVAMDKNGNFVVVWQSNGQDGNGWGVYGQRFSADGTKQGSEFLINATTTRDQRYANVSMDATGNFIVTWTSNDGASVGNEIYARRYDSSGNALSGEFKVNQTILGAQQHSSVKMLNNGGFIITWTGTDSQGTGVYGRRYGANGSPLSGTDGDEFLINSTQTGNASFASVGADKDGNFSVAWMDTASGSEEVYNRSFTITQSVNNPPTDIALSNNTVSENVADGTLIGALSTTDPDDPGKTGTYSYALVAGEGDNDNSAFTIVNNELRINQSPDFENKSTYSLRIQTTDATGLSFEKILTVNITNLNEAPTSLLLSNNKIDENVAASSVVGQLSTVDPDASNTFIYSLVSGTGSTDNAAFSIVGNELRINASPNFETKPSYSVRVRSTDQNGLSVDSVLVISVNDLNDAPTNIALSSTSINENVPANSVIGSFSTTDPDATDTFTYQLVSGTGSTDNAAFTIVGNQLQINASPDYEVKNSYSIRVKVLDKGGLPFEKVFTININDLNDPPTNFAPTNLSLSSASVNENVSASTVVGTFSTTDPNAGDTFTYSLVTGTGSTDNSAFTIVNNELRINNSPDFETKSSYSIRVRTTDAGGLNFEKVLTINVNNINEVPTDLNLSPNNIDENSPAGSLIGNLSAVDVDQGETFAYALVSGTGGTDNSAFTLTSDGKLSINNSPNFETQSDYSIRVRVTDRGGAGLSFEKVLLVTINDVAEAGSPTNLVLTNSEVTENSPANTIIGTLITTDDSSGPFTYTLDPTFGDAANFTINASNQLVLTPVANYELKPSYSVRVKTTDPDGLSLTKVLTVTVKDVNEVPTNLALSATTIDENVPANSLVGTLSTTDPDAGETFTYSLVTGTGSTDNSAFTIVNNELRINAAPNFETKPSYSIRIRTTDKNGLFFDKVLTVNVRNVGETPTNINLSATSINENVPTNSAVGTLSTVDADANETFTYTLVAGTGSTDNAAFAIVNNQLQIRNSPNFETKPSYSVRIRSTDKDGLFFEKVFVVNINNINETPTDISLSAASINENVPASSVVGTFGTIDSDANDTFTYSLVSGTGSTDNASFTIVGNQLKINNSPDFETKSSYSIRVQSRDAAGLTFVKVFTIAINDLSEVPGTNAPTNILLSNTLLNENVAPNSVVGTLSTVDPDVTDTFTYSLVSGTGSTDNAAFTIVNNQLQIKNYPDFETKPSYSIRVRTTDKGGLTFEKVFTINVNNLPETPGTTTPRDLSLSNAAVNENLPINTVVGTFSTTDPDQGDTFTYSLVSGTGGTDNAAFAIVNNELRLNSIPDFETKSSYSIRVRTTDVGGLSFEKVFTIKVNNLPETPGTTPPRDILLSNSRIDENRPANSLIGTFGAVDPDVGDTFTYSLASGTGGTDNSAFTLQGNELRIKNAADFETKPTYSIRVRVTDVGGLTFDKVFTISVNDLSELPGQTNPTDLLLSSTSVNENVPSSTVVGTFSTIDPDKNDIFTYTLQPGFGDNSSFQIVGNELRITNSPDFETKSSYSIRAITTDAGGRTFTKTFTINVVNGNDAPVVTPSAGSLSYTEGAGNVAIDPAVQVTDIDSANLTGATVRIAGYVAGQDSLVLTPPAGITANFDAATGILTLSGTATLSAYQTALRSVTYNNSSKSPNTATRTIEFTARDASLTSRTATRTIQITPIDTAPVVTASSGALSYQENSGQVAVDAGITVRDDDSATLTGATVKILGYVRDQDVLDVTTPAGITSNFDAATGVLTLSGNVSPSSYQAALRSITYSNNSGNPSTVARTIQFSVRDATSQSNLATRSIQVVAVNSPPVLTASSGGLSYTENLGAIAIDPQIRVVDADSQNLIGATVKLQGYVAGEDKLSIVSQNGIASNFDAATGILSLTGSATVATYQTLLRSVAYTNLSEDPTTTARTAQFTVQDSATASNLAVRSIQVIPVNDAPVLKTSVQQISLASGTLLIDSQLSLSDVDDSKLTGATVTIGNYIAAEDKLLFKEQDGITGNFDPVTGVLSLTGTAAVSSYQTVLRKVQYNNRQTIPTAVPRQLTIQATDGKTPSSLTNGQVQVNFIPTGTVPTIDLNGTGVGVDYSNTFVVGGPAVSVVASDARFTNQTYPVLTSAKITIANLLNGSDEKLSVDTSGTGLVASYDPTQGVLTLSGVASLSTYLPVLRSVQYNNTSAAIDTTTRTILFTLNNGTNISEPAQTRVQISQIRLENGTGGTDGSLITTSARDLIDAGTGNDTVLSNVDNLQQNDRIDGGSDRDTFTLIEGGDTTLAQMNDGVNATVEVDNFSNQLQGILMNTTTVTNFEVFKLTGFTRKATLLGSDQRDDTLVGGSANDTVLGKLGNDVLGGGAGDDQLDGGTGADLLEGGAGNDLYVVDNPGDLVLEGLNEGFDTIQSDVDFTLTGNVEALSLTGVATVGVGNSLDNQLKGNIQANRMSGDIGNDSLWGGEGRDELLGGVGNDRLMGEQGRDRLVGEQGKDSFVLTSARKGNQDVIRDFRSVDDTIEVVRGGFGRSLKFGKIRKSQFCLGEKALDKSDRFIYNRRMGALFFDADGLGGKAQVQIASLSNKASLVRADIIVTNSF